MASRKTKLGKGLSLQEAMHLQYLEGNPLSPDQVAMFEMFEREGWSHERRLAYIKRLAVAAAKKST